MKKLFNQIVRAEFLSMLRGIFASRLAPTGSGSGSGPALASVFALLLLPSLSASADTSTATATMENSRNPLMLMRTSRGDVYIELVPAAAPRNVANFIGLATAKVPMFDVTTGTTVNPYFYDNMDFYRVLP